MKVAFNPWGNKLWYTETLWKSWRAERCIYFQNKIHMHILYVSDGFAENLVLKRIKVCKLFWIKQKKNQGSSICSVSWSRYSSAKLRWLTKLWKNQVLYWYIFYERISIPSGIKDKTDWDSDLISWFLESGLSRWHELTKRFWEIWEKKGYEEMLRSLKICFHWLWPSLC